MQDGELVLDRIEQEGEKETKQEKKTKRKYESEEEDVPTSKKRVLRNRLWFKRQHMSDVLFF